MVHVAPHAESLSIQLQYHTSPIGLAELDLLWTNRPELTKLHIDIPGDFTHITFRPCRLPSLKELHAWSWEQMLVGLGSPIETLTISYFPNRYIGYAEIEGSDEGNASCLVTYAPAT